MPLCTEGVLSLITTGGDDVAVIRRWSDQTGTHRGVIAINRNAAEARTIRLTREDLPRIRASIGSAGRTRRSKPSRPTTSWRWPPPRSS